jgi:hypothetical protein
VVVANQSATFSGQLMVPVEEHAYCQAILYYSDASAFNIYNAQSISTTDFDNDGRFTLALTDLEVGSRFNYSLCVEVKSQKMFTPVDEFVIVHPYADPKDYAAATATDLSEGGTANCYIVSDGGLYKFKAVKGNSSESVSGMASAEILWETFGTSTAPQYFDLIEGVCCKDGYIVFKTADEFKEGNALIAAKNAQGEILWSWHIWMTDMPAEQAYLNEAGVFMDRNLGAVSSTPGDVGALGLMYQWGRKDPFLGSSSITSATTAKSTIKWPAPVASDSFTGTIEYAAANPTTFITYNTLNNDWYYTDAAAVDTTRWSVSSEPKTIHDPCPAGWRIPEGGSDVTWGTALGVTIYKTCTFDKTNNGIQMGGLLGEDENIWYPASGNIDHSSGKLARVSTAGIWWTVDLYKTGQHYVSVIYINGTNGRFYVYDYGIHARGYSARCIKEEE